MATKIKEVKSDISSWPDRSTSGIMIDTTMIGDRAPYDLYENDPAIFKYIYNQFMETGIGWGVIKEIKPGYGSTI